jgi:hypothetical protein
MSPENNDDGPELPRGATPSELDALRATVRATPRAQVVVQTPRPSAPPPPPPTAMVHRGEVDRIIDDGRSLLDLDPRAAHDIFEKAWRRNLNDPRVLSNYDLARALVVTRNKEQAVRALRKAMELSPDDPRVVTEFAALGLRRPPPIPWLPREFFLNKWIGKLTWKYSRRARLDQLTRPE